MNTAKTQQNTMTLIFRQIHNFNDLLNDYFSSFDFIVWKLSGL